MGYFHTFSIVAYCLRTRQLGIATSTAALAGGAFVPHVRAGVGAVATQSFTNPYLAHRALDLLSVGHEPDAVVRQVLAADDGRELRQLAIVDSAGRAAAMTGEHNEPWAGHIVKPALVVAGNMLAGPQVIQEMAAAFQAAVEQKLAERLVRALEAGQAAGGDKRGKQSAALYVVGQEDYGEPDLRADDNPQPVAELRRLWELFQNDLEPVMPLFPTKSHPTGELNKEVWMSVSPDEPEQTKSHDDQVS